MERFAVLVLLLSLVMGIFSSSPSNGDSDVAGLKQKIEQLEHTLSDLQARSQTQEQKYSALLSSVLSKLLQTTGELTSVKSELKDVKNDYNFLQNEMAIIKVNVSGNNSQTKRLSEKISSNAGNLTYLETGVRDMKSRLNKCDADVASMRSDNTRNNSTLTSMISQMSRLKSDFSTLKTANNITDSNLHGLASMVSKINSVQKTLASRLSNTEQDIKTMNKSSPHVGFQVMQTVRADIFPYRLLQFNSVKYNAGDGYTQHTGLFKAPVSGVYLFWVSINVGNTSHGKRYSLEIQTGLETIGSGEGVSSNDTLTVIALAHVETGENVWFKSSDNVHIACNPFSNYGGILLH